MKILQKTDLDDSVVITAQPEYRDPDAPARIYTLIGHADGTDIMITPEGAHVRLDIGRPEGTRALHEIARQINETL